jgi:hypothetical protein
MVLGRTRRIVEASWYITVSCLGELDWNETKSKRSSMISLWNTHGYRTYLFGIEPQSSRAPSCPRSRPTESAGFGFFRPLEWPEQTSISIFYVCLRSSNSERCLIMVGVTVYLRDSLGDAGSVGRVYLQKRTLALQHTTSSLLFGPDGGSRMERCVAHKRYNLCS